MLFREHADGSSTLREGWGDGFIFTTCEYVKHKTIISEGLFKLNGRTEICAQLTELEPHKHLGKTSLSRYWCNVQLYLSINGTVYGNLIPFSL